MKVTKYEHACVVLEEQGKKLVIDPGEFSSDFGPRDNIAVVVITHNHSDHYVPEHLKAIIESNPEVVIFTTPEIVEAFGDTHAVAVHAYDDQVVGPFTLRFFGETHATIHRSVEPPQNIGVLVNGFYYPGDSLVEADQHATILAIPAAAPWLKVGEAMDLITEMEPARCFPTHDIMLSDRGHDFTNYWLGKAAEKAHVAYTPLKPGESFEF